jgi:hypothetical protein
LVEKAEVFSPCLRYGPVPNFYGYSPYDLAGFRIDEITDIPHPYYPELAYK